VIPDPSCNLLRAYPQLATDVPHRARPEGIAELLLPVAEPGEAAAALVVLALEGDLEVAQRVARVALVLLELGTRCQPQALLLLAQRRTHFFQLGRGAVLPQRQILGQPDQALARFLPRAWIGAGEDGVAPAPALQDHAVIEVRQHRQNADLLS